MSNIKQFLLFIFFVSKALAYEVSHVQKPFSNFETTALNNACSNLKFSRYAVHCNPALFPFLKMKRNFLMSIHGKSDNSGIQNAKKYLFDDISQSDLEKLFNQDNFNSFTFNSSLSFYTEFFVLSYSPYYIVADVLVNNPSFPIISLLLVDRSTLSLSYGIPIVGDPDSDDFFISLGAQVSYYSEKYLNSVFSAADLTGNSFKDKLNFQKEKRAVGNIGGFVEWKEMSFLPSISFNIRNLGETREVDESRINSVSRIELSQMLEGVSEIGLGYNFYTFLGGLYFGSTLPFSGVFNESQFEFASVGIRHSLGMFSTYLSIGQYFDSLAFKLSSKSTSVALVFAREQEIFEFNKTKEKAVYFNMEIGI
jgi:hypothetical protein